MLKREPHVPGLYLFIPTEKNEEILNIHSQETLGPPITIDIQEKKSCQPDGRICRHNVKNNENASS